MTLKKLSVCALAFALIFIFTMLKIPIAVVGYIHIGDAAILLFSMLLPPFLSATVAGLSSAFVDLVSGYGNYVLATLIIKALLGLIASLFLQKQGKNQWVLFISMWLIIVGGYWLWDVIQFQTLEFSLISIAANSVQVLVSFLLFQILANKVNKSNLIKKKS